MKKLYILIIIVLFYSFTLSGKKRVFNYNFIFTGDMFYNFLMDKNYNDNERISIENIRGDITGGIKFFNRHNSSGIILARLSTDYSYYELSFYKFNINFIFPGYRLFFFYRTRFLNFNDGLRLLDNDIKRYKYPIIFYHQLLIPKEAKWGKDFMGVSLSFNKYINESLTIAKKYKYDESNNFSIISRSKKLIKLSDDIKIEPAINFIYINQNYQLPEVNSSGWAEYNGVWYEFNTNSYYDPATDYTIKSTLEFNINLLNTLTLWGEGGIDNKEGGYYGETLQKATYSGNTNYSMILNSPSYKKLIVGGGIKFDIDFLIIEGDYLYDSSKENSISYYSNKIHITNLKNNKNEITIKIKFDKGIINNQFEFNMVKFNNSSDSILFDKYNYNDIYITNISSLISLKDYIRISAGKFKLLPEVEYNIYDSEFKTTTLQAKTGINFSLSSKFDLYTDVRYKYYNIESITNQYFINPFISVRYKYNQKIYFEIGYGLDDRLLEDNEYGFEYYLNSKLENKNYNIEKLLEAENKISKNNYITITGYMRF